MSAEIDQPTRPESPVSDDIDQFLKETGCSHLNSRLTKLVRKVGWEATARVLGYDVRSYKNLELAGKMLMYNIKKQAAQSITEYANILKERLSPAVIDYIHRYGPVLQKQLDERSSADYQYEFFAATVWQRNYLMRVSVDTQPVETPQMLFMRLAIQFYHDQTINDVITCFQEMSNMQYIHASPTMFNAGMLIPTMSSCFLGSIEDNRVSIMKHGVVDAGLVSCGGGGLGIDVSRLRHSEVGRSSGYVGRTKGLVPVCYLYNALVRLMDQKGRRKGAETVMTRSHHIDLIAFAELSLPTGDHYSRAHDLNTSILTSWEFWRRVEEDKDWTLFCPRYTTKLNDVSGDAFIKQYRVYETQAAKGELDSTVPGVITHKTMKARKLLDILIDIQCKAGMPYMMNWDAANFKSNHRHLGYIRGTNLCQEIVQYVGKTVKGKQEFAVCNLASLSFRAYAIAGRTEAPGIDPMNYINFQGLGLATRSLVKNLNRVIDHTNYPTEGASVNNMKHRPIGIGAQGFAELLYILDVLPEAEVTKKINVALWACMYFNAMVESIEEAVQHGPYETFKGSPLSEGKFQFDLWAEEFEYLQANGYLFDDKTRVKEDDLPMEPSVWRQESITLSNGHLIEPTWDSLETAVVKYGARNSLLLTAMPTASSSNVMGNTETVEIPQQGIFSRSILGGSYPILNRYLQQDLEVLGLWNKYTVDLIQSDLGSINRLNRLVKDHLEWYPQFRDRPKSWDRLRYVQLKYKTMWELSQKIFLKMAADRGRYICQSQSTNVYLADPTIEQLRAVLRLANRLGLKTLIYYLRRLAGSDPIKFTILPEISSYVKDLDIIEIEEILPEISSYVEDIDYIEIDPSCQMENGCISCSS